MSEVRAFEHFLWSQASEGITLGNAGATARVLEGFIGGGAILVGKMGTRGTATAASIWAKGAIGAAVRLGSYDTAIVLYIVTFATLRVMTNFKSPEDSVGRPPEETNAD